MHIPYLRRLFEEVNMYLLEFEEHKGLVSALPPEENLKGQKERRLATLMEGVRIGLHFQSSWRRKCVLCCGRCDA